MRAAPAGGETELVELVLDSTHLEGNALGRIGERVAAEEIVAVLPIVGAVLRIDDPDFKDTHGAIVFKFALETLKAVFRG